jgi:hypothetical protein
LDSIAAIRRIVEIALFDVVGLENSIARARVLIAGALAAAKLIETGELEARLAALEAASGLTEVSVSSDRGRTGFLYSEGLS